MCKNFIFNIHKEGYKFIAIALVVSFLATAFSFPLGLFFLLVTLYVCYFFRDPEIVLPSGDDIVVSPAHGLITKIETNIKLPESLSTSKVKYNRISIFLSVFDIHVNRNPLTGVVKGLNYVAGKFINATLDKSSSENERQEILIETPQGHDIAVVQIAGLIARRIVCDLEVNDQISIGDRFGIIRFGSRVDIYLPDKYEITAKERQTMIGGETVIARLLAKK